jgi:hypothetical protein
MVRAASIPQHQGVPKPPRSLREPANTLCAVSAAVCMGLLPMPCAAQAQPQIQTSSAVRLRFTVIVPHSLFLGIGAGPMSAQELSKLDGVPPITAHLIAVSVHGNRGPVTVRAENHEHQRPHAMADSSLSNTPMPVPDVDARQAGEPAACPNASGREPRRAPSWTYSYVNSVMARPHEAALPVVYTATMP